MATVSPERSVAAVSPQPSFLSTRLGLLTLLLLCTVQFLDIVDASIVNVAMPSIQRSLHFSQQSLQWVASGYILTYGGLLLLGGRAADLLGRRRVLVAGLLLFASSSLTGGLATSSSMLIGARLAQGVGAAMMAPAALSILTTSFAEGAERNRALGIWGGVSGLAAAAGVFFGGLLSEGPGWRWVLFVNLPVCTLVLAASFLLLNGERRRAPLANFDSLGAVLATGGMLTLIYALVKAPDVGWGAPRTIALLATAGVTLAAFVLSETRVSNPLAPLSIFKVKGLAAADATQLMGFAGFFAVFFFLTLYMQNVLGFSPLRAGAAYLPITAGFGIAAGLSPRLFARVGTRAVMVGGSLIAASGIYYLSRIPVHGSYLIDVLPGLMIMVVGVGAVFVAVATAANAGVPADKAGLAAGLLNSAQQLGSALGLAIFSALATARTNDLLSLHANRLGALTSGYQRALLACSIFVVASALIALRSPNTGRDPSGAAPEPALEAV